MTDHSPAQPEGANTMLVTLAHAELSKAITAAATALPVKPAHPIFAGLLLEADDGLLVSSYDQHSSIRVAAEAEIGTEGRALVSGRLLAQVAKLLPKQPVTLAVPDGATMMQISAGRAAFGLPLLAVDDYPALPEPGTVTGSVDGKQFAAAVAFAAAAALRDDGNAVKQHLSAVMLSTDATTDGLYIVGTDGYRIHWDAVDWTGDPGEALVPAKSLASLAAVLEQATEPVGLHFGRTFAVVGAGLHRTIPTIDHDYVQWRKPFEAQPVGVITVDSAELVAALKRAAGMTDHHLVRLTPSDDDTMRITAGESDGVSVEDVDIEIAGDPPELTVNAAYLSDAIAGLKQPQIALTFTGATRPILGNLDGARKFAVMPTRT